MKYYTDYTNKDYLLNIQQQVEKNKRDIATHYEIDRTLADYGIRIIGFYETIEDAVENLGDPYDGPYGNAVGIGFSAPYTFYIWTRANNVSEVDYWQDVGELAVMGPQGPEGPQGEQGPAGENAKIFTGRGVPTVSVADYSIYINAQNGDVYKPGDGEWVLTGNIRGPQGLQGPEGQKGDRGPKGLTGAKGETGDPGGFIKISGRKVSSSELPDPEEIQDLEVAYLVGTEEPYELWIQVGATYEDAIWHNIGALNLATYITVNGEFQNIWDADTKLDKVNINDGEYHAYVIADDGSQDTMYISTAEDPECLVQRGSNGEIYVPEWPVDNKEAVSKVYVDSLIQDSDTISTYWEGPDLSLKLNPDIVADIEKSVKIPTSAPGSAKTVPVYDRATGNVAWTGTTSWVAAANSPRWAQKTSTWNPQTLQGQTYEVFGYDANSPTFDMSLTLQDGTTTTLNDLSYARVVMINTNWLYVMAYSGTQLKVITYVKKINTITKSKVFAIKYNSGTVL